LDEQHEPQLLVGEEPHRLADAEALLWIVDADLLSRRDANLARPTETPA
jgi:hypothetical protein